MSHTQNEISLGTRCIQNVPLESYDEFTFIVNDQRYKTTRIVADLISKKISRMHSIDPTIDAFSFKTENKGDFKIILDLVDFERRTIEENDLLFVAEALQILESQPIFNSTEEKEKISNKNIFEQIEKHEKYSILYEDDLENDINYISSHFYDLCSNNSDNIAKLSSITIEKIIKNSNLHLESEDQLLYFIINLYTDDIQYANLFECVDFSHLTQSAINEFLSNFNISDINNEIWNQISMRLKRTIVKDDDSDEETDDRYHREIHVKNDLLSDFEGIINYIQTNSKNGIFHEIDITSSSIYCDDEQYSPKNTIHYHDQSIEFCTIDEDNPWLCFEFLNYKIKLTQYSIRSTNYSVNKEHPRSWIIEGSNDNSNWEILDMQRDCTYLNGSNLSHTFDVKNTNKDGFSFIRMRHIGSNWCDNSRHLNINCIEFYGDLI